MSRKPKFKPEITRVKLNPEQAVLGCNCYNQGIIDIFPASQWNPGIGGSACNPGWFGKWLLGFHNCGCQESGIYGESYGGNSTGAS